MYLNYVINSNLWSCRFKLSCTCVHILVAKYNFYHQNVLHWKGYEQNTNTCIGILTKSFLLSIHPFNHMYLVIYLNIFINSEWIQKLSFDTQSLTQFSFFSFIYLRKMVKQGFLLLSFIRYINHCIKIVNKFSI